MGDYAYEGTPEQTKESLLVNHFIHNLNPLLRRKMQHLETAPKKLEDAIRKAERFQRLKNLDEEEEQKALVAAMSQLTTAETRENPRPPPPRRSWNRDNRPNWNRNFRQSRLGRRSDRHQNGFQ
ncbi:hypothetical protein B9Z55_000924 [Caenorhabditis nigoni]|uniref:Uncharacterized protein n=1 Tax=Caenorhabditis nigoni TaxID=1611254 RepID=A0A2G5VVI0_9PELO|nr:hypothetical protein B9Z55_000924 [Caenorhabditis nigoni]